MVDYQALKALEAVIDFQSFEQASRSLGISQSAVSQRIQTYESYLSNKLLIRKPPYEATKLGKAYLNLLRKVTSLESEFQFESNLKPILRLAINRDSLDTYFLDVLKDKDLAELITIKVIADDQDKTIEYLKSGQVDMCISSQEKSLPNHTSIYLGDMVYTLVCSKGFHAKYFSKGVDGESLANAPLVVFDKHDKVQHKYLKEHYNIESFTKINSLPSVPSFKKAIVGGFGYGLLPILDIKGELSKKQIVQLNPKKDYHIALYLHQWEYQQNHIKIFNSKLKRVTKTLLESS